MASKDMPVISDSGRLGFSYVGFSRLAPHQARLFPFHETKIAAKLSHFSYLAKLEETAEGGVPIVVESDPVAQTRAHVWINKRTKTAFVSFRGTSTWMDVIHDLDTRPVPADARPDITVHAGFRYKFFSIKNALEEVLMENLADFDTLVLTGHSLGGALATIAAPFLSDMFPAKTVKCISFGSPRVGNENFVKWFQSTVDSNVRIVNEHDPVPHLPLGSAYHHVSDGICIVPDSLYSFPEIPVGQRLFWAMENLDLSQTTISHDLQTYISRVNMYN
jgi:predicted lipase